MIGAGAAPDRIPLFVVSALTGVLFAVTNLPWTLDDYDQAKQAFVAYQMVDQHRWLYQTTPMEGMPSGRGRHTSHHVATKPPGVGWISASLYTLTRSWDFAWRFPSFVAAIALAWLVFRTASHSFGRFPGVIALAALSFNVLSVRLATLVRTDMPLALVTFATGVLIFEKIRSRTPWSDKHRVNLFGLLTAAMFVKGPIVYAFILPPLALYQWRRRKNPEWPNAWSGWWPWTASCGLFLLWVIGGVVFVNGFFADVVVNEFAGRFHEGVHRSQPLWFYIPHLVQKFAPWTLLMIGLFILALRRKGASRSVSPEAFWLITWTLGAIIVMSLIPSKRVDRVFPVIPTACLLLAWQIRSGCSKDASSLFLRRVAICTMITGAIFTTGYSALRVISGYRTDRDALEKFGREVRRIAATENLRYEVVRAPDEGLLLYLQRPRFIALSRLPSLPSPSFDGLVVPLDEEPWRSNRIRPRLTVEEKGSASARYGLLDLRGQSP